MKKDVSTDKFNELLIEGSFLNKSTKIMKDAYTKRVPLMRYKINDSTIRFKGQKVPVEDLFKFTKRGSFYYPTFILKDDLAEDKTIDMTPFICVGVSELLQVIASDLTPGAFDEELMNVFSNAFFTIDELNKILNKICISSDNWKNYGVMPIAYNMTSPYIDYRFPNIKRFASMLLILAIGRPSLACEFILKAMEVAYTYVSIFYYDKGSLGTLIEGNNEFKAQSTNSSFSEFMTEKLLKFRKIGYIVPETNTKHYISDCRGISIYSALILMQSIYNNFSEMPSSAKPLFDFSQPFITEQNQKVFSSCIGDDVIGSYLKIGRVVNKDVDFDKFGSFIISTGLYVIKGTQVYNICGRDVLREAYEHELLLRHANNVSYNNFKSKNYHRNFMSVNYFENMEQLWGSTYNFMSGDLSKTYLDANQIKEFMNKLDSVEKLQAQLDSIKADSKVKLDRVVNEWEKKYSSVIDSYEKKIIELEYQLSTKSDFIAKLSNELEVANSKLESVFTEEDLAVEALSSEDISLEDMIDFLNGFKFTMVGGRDELLSKLKEIGWTNVSQISSESASNTAMQSDFFCINTRFISHKIVRLVESDYASQRDQMFYYNGTNIQLLVQVCYDFVTAWFEKES